MEFTEKVKLNIGHIDVYSIARIPKNWVCRTGQLKIGHSDAYSIAKSSEKLVSRKDEFENWA